MESTESILESVLEALDLELAGFGQVKIAWEKGAAEQALNELLAYFRARKRTLFLVDKGRVFNWLREEQSPEIKRVADELTDNVFLFNQPWDMEKCLTPVRFENDCIDWHHIEEGDDEWMFMLNRHHYLPALVQQYIASGDEKYYRKFEVLITGWMEQEPNFYGREETTWRTIDTGIRVKHWLQALDYLLETEIFSPELFVKMLDYLHKQVNYLFSCCRPELSLSNWRILEFHGAFIAAAFFKEWKEAGKWQAEAAGILERSLYLQVTGDGFHWEQSFMYHHEVLLCMLEAMLAGERNSVPLSPGLKECILRMAKASSHLVTPKGEQPCYGDSDVESMKELLTLCALIFPQERFGISLWKEAPLSLVLRYGSGAKEEVKKLDASPLPKLDYAHEDVGNYFVRSGWGKEDSYLFFKNGFLGSGHGHCDLLHFDLIVEGEPVLTDSGRFTYNPCREKRQEYKKASSHNTVTVDEKEFTLQKKAWGTTKVANEIKRPAVLNRKSVLLQGMNLGYFEEHVLINRKILWIKPDIWFVFDEISAGGEAVHTYRQHFHFSKPSVSCGEQGFFYEEGAVKVSFRPLSKRKLLEMDCMVSPAYNQEYGSKKVILETCMKGNGSLGVLIADESHGTYGLERVLLTDMNGMEPEPGCAEALKVFKENREWVVCVNHKEEGNGRKLYMADGTPVYGRTSVIEKEDGKVMDIMVLEY